MSILRSAISHKCAYVVLVYNRLFWGMLSMRVPEVNSLGSGQARGGAES